MTDTPQDRREEELIAENEALRAQYREICKTTDRLSRDKINLEAEVERLRYAMKDAKYDLSKLKVSGGQYSVWQSYHGRIAYETLDRALNP